MTTIVLTCIGGMFSIETLSQLRADSEIPVRIVGVDGSSATSNRHFVDAFHQVPLASGEPEAFASAIREVCRRERADVLVPCADEEVLAIAREKASFAPTICATESASTLELLRDKVALFDYLAASGVALPAYAAVGTLTDLSAAAERLGYPRVPFILKPRSGRGARGIVLADPTARGMVSPQGDRSPTMGPLEAIAEALASQPGPLGLMAMAYLPGTIYDVDCVAIEGQPLCIVPRRRLWDGPFSRGVEGHEVIDAPDLEAMTAQISQALRMNYAFDCDFGTAADGRPGLLEVNPRLSGSAPAALAGGVNIPLVLLRAIIGLPVARPTIVPGGRAYPVTRMAFKLGPA